MTNGFLCEERAGHTCAFSILEAFPLRLLIALLLPFVLFFTIGRPFAGIICLILQITLIGWAPAAIWAAYALSQFETDRKISEMAG